MAYNMQVENQQNTTNGIIWAGATLVSGSTTVGAGLLTSLLLSVDHVHLSYSKITEPLNFAVDLNVTKEARAVLIVGTFALALLTANCYQEMSAQLGFSRKVSQQ